MATKDHNIEASLSSTSSEETAESENRLASGGVFNTDTFQHCQLIPAVKLQQMSCADLLSAKKQLVSSIQEVSLCLGQLLEQRHDLQEEVAGRHVTIGQLLRVQEARASELGLQPPVQMSAVVRR